MKNKLFKSGFCEKLKLLLIPIGLLIGSLTTQVWADQSLGRVDMVYDFNGTEQPGYAYYPGDNNNNPVLPLGPLTSGTFKIKKVYWHCYDNWVTVGGIDAFGWYNMGNGDTKFVEYLAYTGSNSDTDGSKDHEIKHESVDFTVATANTGNSGLFTFSHWWIANFNYSGGHHQTGCYNSSKNYNFTFAILPPDVSDFTITASGSDILSGSGTNDDPYIIAHNGSFTLTLSDASPARPDANSSAQYSVDGGSSWGTTDDYTSYTISNITATGIQDYVFKARYHHSDVDLDGDGYEDDPLNGAVKEKTIYYKTSPWAIVGTMNNWDVNTDLIHDYAGGTGAGYVDINLDANETYEFKVKDRTKSTDDWYGYNTALTYSDSGNEKTFITSEGNCSMTTAGAGTYRFTWDGTNKKLIVTYPTSYTVTFGHGDHGTTVTASGSTSGSITSGQYVAKGEDVEFSEEHDDGYSLKGWYTTADGNTVVSGMSSGDNTLDNIGGNKTVYAQYIEDTYTVTVQYKFGSTSLHADGEVTGVGITTTQEAEAIDIEGYDFSEWSTLPSSIQTSDELTESSITINATADATITANYTPTEYEGIINKTTGTSNGSYTVVYKETSLTPSAPSKSGYHVANYYLSYNDLGDEEEFDYKIADASGNLQPSVTYSSKTYTNSSSEWVYDGDAPLIYAKWAGNSHTLKLYKNDGTGDYASTSVTVGSNSYTINNPTRAGYDFTGFYTAATSGTLVVRANLEKVNGDYFDASSNWKYDDNVELYAQWDEVGLEFVGTDDDWNTASNWSPACVPTSGHDVTINAAATVSGSAVAKSVTINQSTGSLTIASTGTLDVIGTISNAADERLEVMAGGALIFDYSSAPSATVHHSVSGGDFRYIALPISYVHVSNAFSGSGVYTYVWHEGSGWERRGYYDDISCNEPIAISGQSSWTFYGTLVNALFGSVANTSGDYAGTNMYANSWTAPIKISGVSITGNADQTVYTDNGGSWFANTAGDPGSAVIPAMSAFVILANEGGGSVSIPYNTAVRNVAVSPASAPKRVASDDLRKHITMNVSGNELTTNLRLYENEQFTNEFDNGWDARFLEGDGRAGQLYSQTDDKMVILAAPDLEGTVVGFIPGEAANYTISFEGDGKGYYLSDLDMQESTLIEEGNTYVFTPNESSNATRFVISKTPIHKTTTGNDAIYDGVKARKQMIDGVLYIIRDGRMYNAEGMLVK